MLDKLREYAKALVAAVVPLLSVALITNIEKLDELDAAWKAVIIAAITALATAIVPNKPPAPEE